MDKKPEIQKIDKINKIDKTEKQDKQENDTPNRPRFFSRDVTKLIITPLENQN